MIDHTRITGPLDRTGDWLVPTLARIVVLGVLFIYFWNSALTKFGDGILGLVRPSNGAYFQIFPKAVEAAGYDLGQLGILHWAIALAGTWAEVLLPIAIVIGLATRLAALAMIGFVIVQSYVDVTGHGGALGMWFDAQTLDIVDVRAFWMLAFAVLVLRGAGPVSVDALLARRWGTAPQPA